MTHMFNRKQTVEINSNQVIFYLSRQYFMQLKEFSTALLSIPSPYSQTSSDTHHTHVGICTCKS